MTEWVYQLVEVPDGRVVEVLSYGSGDRALVYFTGTPGGACPDEELARFADTHRFRVVAPLRPGYGQSSPRPGRRIVDVVEDVDHVLDHLGVTEVVCMGGSGGGPHALAVAARLQRCAAAAVLVSPAPRDAEGLDFYDGMALSNQDEWRLADEGEEQLRPWLEKTAQDLRPEGTDGFVELFDDTLSAEDRAFMEGAGGPALMARYAKAIEVGTEGWLEDDIAMTTPWGFALEDITTPVTFWAGQQDQFISCQHTHWMAQRVPRCDVHVYGNEGHVSLRLHHLPAMMADLLAKAGW